MRMFDMMKAFITPVQSIAQTMLRVEKHLSRMCELYEADLRDKGVYVPDPERISKLSQEDKRVELMYGSTKSPFAEE